MNDNSSLRTSKDETLRAALREARQVIVTACGTKAPYARIAIERIDAALQASWSPDETGNYSQAYADQMRQALLRISLGPDGELPNSEVAAWAASIAHHGLLCSAEKASGNG